MYQNFTYQNFIYQNFIYIPKYLRTKIYTKNLYQKCIPKNLYQTFIPKMYTKINAFTGYDNYMFILATTHVKFRMKFGLLINIVYLEIFPTETNLLFDTPFSCTVAQQPGSHWFIIIYIFNFHDDYEKYYVYENDQFFVP